MDTGYKVAGSITMVLAYLRWGWALLFHLSFFHHRYCDYNNYYYYHHPAQHRVQEYYDSNGVVVVATRSSEDCPECAVCLSKVVEGDEILELTCGHVFHKVCLDRWSQSSFTRRCPTCPLCRRSLITPAACRGSSTAEPEVLLFDFASFVSSDRDTRDTWWLR